MSQQSPILATRENSPLVNLGSSRLLHLIPSEKTGGEFSVVEFVSEPGEGVGRHIHENEEELVFLVEGQIEVILADQKLTVTKGACALLPRKIPHGYVNTGTTTSRLLAVLLPGRLDTFFVELGRELSRDQKREEAIGELCARFGLKFLS